MAALSLAVVPLPAFAQYGPGPALHPADIFDDLRDAGFSPVRLIGRNGDIYIVEARDRTGQRLRLIVDAFDGEVLERFAYSEPARAQARPAEGARNTLASREDAPTPKSGPVLPPQKRPAAAAPQPVPTPPSPPQAAATPPSPIPIPAQGAPRQVGPAPVAPARRPGDWAPINSVPVAPLE